MRKPLLRTPLIALLAVAAAYSQPLPMRAVVPLSFVAGGSTLPAGEYTVDQSTQGVIHNKVGETKGGRRHVHCPTTIHCCSVRFVAGLPSLRKYPRAVPDLDPG
jgi:hypothetical protein